MRDCTCASVQVATVLRKRNPQNTVMQQVPELLLLLHTTYKVTQAPEMNKRPLHVCTCATVLAAIGLRKRNPQNAVMQLVPDFLPLLETTYKVTRASEMKKFPCVSALVHPCG